MKVLPRKKAVHIPVGRANRFDWQEFGEFVNQVVPELLMDPLIRIVPFADGDERAHGVGTRVAPATGNVQLVSTFSLGPKLLIMVLWKEK